MYIRTKDGIYDTSKEYRGKYIHDGIVENIDGMETTINQADTIEELIQDGDILYIYDLYPDTVLVVEGNIKPFGYNDKITLKDWLEFEHTKFDLYIKNSKDNYIKAAHKEPWEKLELC